jgi:hypothetical protein
MEYWQMLETETKNTEGVRMLAMWSTEHHTAEAPHRTPLGVFLDLIGWSEENYGQDLVPDRSGIIGYVEADYLGDALKDWANRPQDVTAWLDRLMWL